MLSNEAEVMSLKRIQSTLSKVSLRIQLHRKPDERNDENVSDKPEQIGQYLQLVGSLLQNQSTHLQITSEKLCKDVIIDVQIPCEIVIDSVQLTD